MKIISYSKEDVAGCNIADVLRKDYDFLPGGDFFDGIEICEKSNTMLIGSKTHIPQLSVFGKYNPEVMVVVSRHKSESGRPTLTTHATGNFGSADVGGLPGRLSIVPAQYLHESLSQLLCNRIEGYDVSLEVTHHGPTELSFPLFYVEVGSNTDEWNDLNAVNVIAGVADRLISAPIADLPTGIGFGGMHYAPNFTKVKGVALGHIMPKYAMEFLDEEMFLQMVEKTIPKPTKCVLDWKGLRGTDKKKITEFAQKHGLEIVRTSDLK